MNSPPTLSLKVDRGALSGQKIALSAASQTLGRAPDCDVTLDGYSRVSRHHALLQWQNGEWILSDQNSTNGTQINGQKITRAALKNGSRLELGDFSAVVQIEGAKSNSLTEKWRGLPGSPPQKWGALGAAGIVLLLGAIGMRSSTPNATVLPPNIPDAPTAPVAPNPVAPIEPVNGRISPAAIQNAKAATVLIAHAESGGYAMGSGFALTNAARIITNRHVVTDENGNVRDCALIFEAGTPRQRKIEVSASQIALAPSTGEKDAFQDDLAVISLENGQTPALPAGKSESLTETDEVYVVGFPLGVETLTLNRDLPSASVKAARVERLQTDKNGAVSVIQLGSSVTHGNSGGPVINNRGEVVGVISSGVEGTGMSYAIPMGFVNALDNSP